MQCGRMTLQAGGQEPETGLTGLKAGRWGGGLPSGGSRGESRSSPLQLRGLPHPLAGSGFCGLQNRPSTRRSPCDSHAGPRRFLSKGPL